MCKICNSDTKVSKTERARSYPRPTHVGGGRMKMYRSDINRYNETTRIYVSIADETILQNLMNRGSEPVSDYRKLVIAQYPEFEGRIKWSRKAGCKMCPCSPGFILDTVLRDEKHQPLDIWITIGERAPKEPVVDMSYVEMAIAA